MIIKDEKTILGVIVDGKPIKASYKGVYLVFETAEPEPMDKNGYVEIRVNAPDGEFIVPLSQRAAEGEDYSFDVYVNDVLYGSFAGTNDGSGAGVLLTGLNPGLSTIRIEPNGPLSEGWGKSIGFGDSYSGAGEQTNKDKLVAVINNSGYAYLESPTHTGDYSKDYQWSDCHNLTEVCVNTLPDTVIHISDHYQSHQYSGCIKLTSPAEEEFPDGIVTILSYCLWGQYSSCTSLVSLPSDRLPASVTEIGDYFMNGRFDSDESLLIGSFIHNHKFAELIA